jgi:hypothetical protein
MLFSTAAKLPSVAAMRSLSAAAAAEVAVAVEVAAAAAAVGKGAGVGVALLAATGSAGRFINCSTR